MTIYKAIKQIKVEDGDEVYFVEKGRIGECHNPDISCAIDFCVAEVDGMKLWLFDVITLEDEVVELTKECPVCGGCGDLDTSNWTLYDMDFDKSMFESVRCSNCEGWGKVEED